MNKILITGASSYVGMRLIQSIDNKNQFILAHYSSSKKFLSFIKNKKFKSKILPVKSDFKKKSDIKKFIKKIKKYNFNIIIHLASKRIKIERFHKLETNDFINEINLSFYSILKILKIQIPKMILIKKTKVVFLLSSNTSEKPSPYLSHYTSLKYLLLGLMKSLSVEYKNYGININSISPSMMETPFLKKLDKKFVDLNRHLSPQKKFLSANEVVKLIKSLISNKSNANGTNFVIQPSNKRNQHIKITKK